MRTQAGKKLAELLREFAKAGQHGQPRTARDYYMGSGAPSDYCTYYHSWECGKVDFETWLKVSELSRRYRHFVRYCKEILPEWQAVRTIHYADNSVEEVQRDRFGRLRQVMLVAPHGDVCY